MPASVGAGPPTTAAIVPARRARQARAAFRTTAVLVRVRGTVVAPRPAAKAIVAVSMPASLAAWKMTTAAIVPAPGARQARAAFPTTAGRARFRRTAVAPRRAAWGTAAVSAPVPVAVQTSSTAATRPRRVRQWERVASRTSRVHVPRRAIVVIPRRAAKAHAAASPTGPAAAPR